MIKLNAMGWTLLVFLGLALVGAPIAAASIKRPVAAAVSAPTREELLSRWAVLNSECRDGPYSIEEGPCLERTRLDKQLNALGLCYGQGARASYENKWKPCLSPEALAAVNAQIAAEHAAISEEGARDAAASVWENRRQRITGQFSAPIGVSLTAFEEAFSPTTCWDSEVLHQCEIENPPEMACPMTTGCRSVTYTFREGVLIGVDARVDRGLWLLLLSSTRTAYGEPEVREILIGPMTTEYRRWRSATGYFTFVRYGGQNTDGKPISDSYTVGYGPE
jgi:hypothetical protein